MEQSLLGRKKVRKDETKTTKSRQIDKLCNSFESAAYVLKTLNVWFLLYNKLHNNIVVYIY